MLGKQLCIAWKIWILCSISFRSCRFQSATWYSALSNDVNIVICADRTNNHLMLKVTQVTMFDTYPYVHLCWDRSEIMCIFSEILQHAVLKKRYELSHIWEYLSWFSSIVCSDCVNSKCGSFGWIRLYKNNAHVTNVHGLKRKHTTIDKSVVIAMGFISIKFNWIWQSR